MTKKHKVPDKNFTRMDRTVKGRGRFGIAAGGLAGDGDITLIMSADAARTAVAKHFRELLNHDGNDLGTLVKNQWVDRNEAARLLGSVGDQIAQWSDTVDGSCSEIEVDAGVVRPRVGLFRCVYAEDEKVTPAGVMKLGYKVWVIPHGVRLSTDQSRVAYRPSDDKTKGRKR